MSTALICNSCGTENPQDSHFCKKCGTPITVECSQCHQALNGDEKFCPSCGNSVSTHAQVTETSITAEEWVKSNKPKFIVEFVSRLTMILRNHPKEMVSTWTDEQKLNAVRELGSLFEFVDANALDAFGALFKGKLVFEILFYAKGIDIDDVNFRKALPQKVFTHGGTDDKFTPIVSTDNVEVMKAHASSMAVGFMLAGGESEMRNPDHICSAENHFSKYEITENYLQILRESFYIGCVGNAPREQLLRDEHIRIASGFYPEHCKSAIESLLQKLVRTLKNIKQGGDDDYFGLGDEKAVTRLVPFSNKGIVESIQMATSAQGINNIPLEHRPLTTEQQEVITYLIANPLYAFPKNMPIGRILAVVKQLWEEEIQLWKNYHLIARGENISVQTDISPAGFPRDMWSELYPGNFLATDMSVWWPMVWAVMFLSLLYLERLYDLIHIRYRYAPSKIEPLPDLLPEADKQMFISRETSHDPEFLKALFPEHQTIWHFR